MNAAVEWLESELLKVWEKRSFDTSAPYAFSQSRYRPPETSPMFILRVAGEDRVLVADRPIKVDVHTQAEGVTAENEALHIYAYGENAEQALREFSSQLVDLHSYYSALSEDDVVGDARRLRALFLAHFRTA